MQDQVRRLRDLSGMRIPHMRQSVKEVIEPDVLGKHTYAIKISKHSFFNLISIKLQKRQFFQLFWNI